MSRRARPDDAEHRVADARGSSRANDRGEELTSVDKRASTIKAILDDDLRANRRGSVGSTLRAALALARNSNRRPMHADYSPVSSTGSEAASSAN